MKAPQFTSSVKDIDELSSVSDSSKPITKLREETTSDLLKWISQITDKRRRIRKKTRCSNLFAETVLSNAIKVAKTELAKKQEEKRRKLKSFTYQLKITSQICPSSEREFLCKDSSPELDDEVKSCIASLDSFFNELNQVKAWVPTNIIGERVPKHLLQHLTDDNNCDLWYLPFPTKERM